MSEIIDLSTVEGRQRLADLAAQQGPVFRVRHACDERED